MNFLFNSVLFGGFFLLSKQDSEKILQFVKREPCLIQDLSRHLDKSWVTTESYVNKIAKETGLIRMKTFRSGTRGAIKVVYWNYAESAQSDEIRGKLFERIKSTYSKEDFDPLEAYQHVPQGKGNVFVEIFDPATLASKKSLIDFFEHVESELLVFSGNLSFLRYPEIKQSFSGLLKRGVQTKLLCRVDIGTLENLKNIEDLLNRFPKQFEVRHSRQPVRGFIVDGKTVRLKEERTPADFKEKEVSKNIRVLYEIYDSDWVSWFQNVFWYLFRTSVNYTERVAALEKVQLK